MTLINSSTKYRVKVYDIKYGASFIPYDNATYNIFSGLWTLESIDGLLVKCDNAIQKINISEGGNYATGYSFGFTTINNGLYDDIISDGAFFKNLKCTLEIDYGSGYQVEWTGIVDSFASGELDIKWRCTDAGKNRTETIGSEYIPIALNRNYNCKLIREEAESEQENFIKFDDGRISAPVLSKLGFQISGTDLVAYAVTLPFSEEAESLINSGENTNILFEVVSGGGTGSTYTVTRFLKGVISGEERIVMAIDADNVDDILTLSDVPNGANVSLCVLKKTKYTYRVTNNSASKIHTKTDFISKKFNIKKNDLEYRIEESQYSIIDDNKIELYAIDKNNSIEAKLSINDNFSDNPITITNVGPAGNTVSLNYTLLQTDVNQLIDLSEKSETLHSIFKITIENAIISESPVVDPKTLTKDQILNKLNFGMGATNDSTYGSSFSFLNLNSLYYSDDSGLIETMDISVINGTIADHYTIEIYYLDWQGYKGLFEIADFPTQKNSNTLVKLNHGLAFFTIPNTGADNTRWDVTQLSNTDNWNIYTEILGLNSISIDRASVGSNGENVQSGNQFETVPETIKYLLTEYMGVDVADIDATSFSDAESDFDNFPSSSKRNAARQIVGQSNANEVLKSLLYNYHLGLFISRDGKYTLNNWLWKSYVLNQDNSAYASGVYTDANFSAITKITRNNITGLTSDYELKYNYSEAEGRFLNTMRITGTESSTFDFDACTEGVNRSEYALAESAHANCHAAYKRLRKLSQTTKETKWTKTLYSDGSNTVEAINFIRTITAHTSREHEYTVITVPYNSDNLDIELLSFIAAQDTIVTNGKPRLGWIVERKINVSEDNIEWKLLLDVSQDDPFITPINIFRDTDSLLVDVIQDDDTSTEIAQDGKGI